MITEELSAWGLRALQNKYVAVTMVALFWATFIHDLGLPFVVREARALNQMKHFDYPPFLNMNTAKSYFKH